MRLKAVEIPRIFRNRVFLATVVLPTILSIFYYGLLASNVYVSETKFLVRATQKSGQPSLLGSLFQSTGQIKASDDTFIVHEYINSRDALQRLTEHLPITTMFGRQDVDAISRYPTFLGNSGFESLFRYYSGMIEITFDQMTSITTLKVSAFTPDDAQKIAAALVDLSENLVNKVNARSRTDLISYAESEVTTAEQKTKDAAEAITRYRTTHAVYDPDRQSVLQFQKIQQLDELVLNTQAELDQLESISPANPQIPSVRSKVRFLEQQVSAETKKISGNGSESIAMQAANFEKLVLDRAFAERQLAAAVSSVETAKNDARKKQIYLEKIVEPNHPDRPAKPRRIKGIATTFFAGLLSFSILSLLMAGVREHQE